MRWRGGGIGEDGMKANTEMAHGKRRIQFSVAWGSGAAAECFMESVFVRSGIGPKKMHWSSYEPLSTAAAL